MLGIIRHNHFLSGYDLAIIDQAIWKYSKFEAPINTNQAYAFTSILTDHVELIFILIAPFYWLFNNVRVLILLQALAISSTGLAVFLLCQRKKLDTWISYALLISFLMFYGIQSAVWADVHSLVFGAAFLAWFLYLIDAQKFKLAWLFFFLTISCKEDMALLTLLIIVIYFLKNRNKKLIGFVAVSIIYLLVIFFVYFPYFVPGGYRYQNHRGLLAEINLQNLYNTPDKRDVLLYSSAWYGFLPFLSPLYLIPALGDVSHYFILGNAVVSSGQNIFGHYRVTLALLLIWPVIITLAKFKRLNNKFIAVYLILCALFLQYYLHLPLSYLGKSWFWKESASPKTTTLLLKSIPPEASLVTQVNILPHASHRNLEFLMWPSTKDFKTNSPCGQKNCLWFTWPGNPEYMIVDISPEYDTRYWLTNKNEFIEGLKNLEKGEVIKLYQQSGDTIIYKVLKRPNY